jgi:oxygen-independent coproporphyrinogen-3 oxidase
MFTERYRSHHDVERKLGAALGKGRAARALTEKNFSPDWSRIKAKLRESPRTNPVRPRGIYIHVPYCDRICSFCSLNRGERGGADLEAYTNMIIAGIEEYGAYPYIREQDFDVVYFGGGTPTTLSIGQFTRILQSIKANIPLAANCEITVESTLHNLDLEKAAALETAGVNRFSIGIQTFSERGRKLLGRSGGSEATLRSLADLRAAFGGILGLDLIYSYPGQSLEEIAFDAETCVSLNVDSVSFYSLMIHDASRLAQSIKKGELNFERDIYFDRERHHLFYKRLIAGGFSLLELSKLAKAGRDRYQYIRIRYDGGDLIPIGSGAGGNIAGFSVYSMGPDQRMVLPPNEKYERFYRILGLLQFGCYDPSLIEKDLGLPAKEIIREKIRQYEAEGFLEMSNGEYRLSADGVFWGNNIAADLIEAIICAT